MLLDGLEDGLRHSGLVALLLCQPALHLMSASSAPSGTLVFHSNGLRPLFLDFHPQTLVGRIIWRMFMCAHVSACRCAYLSACSPVCVHARLCVCVCACLFVSVHACLMCVRVHACL